MLLKRVKLKNFQSHRNSVVTFSSGINVIIGDSDVGKSAILRAMRWVMRNEPSGDGFWNASGKEEGESCLVGIVVSDSSSEDETTVIREKGPAINEYRIYRPTGEIEKFTGFKRNVPEEVVKLLGEPVKFGKDLTFDLNITAQADNAFLIQGVTPRDFARVLGKLTGIDVIDQAEQIAQTRIRQTGSKAKTLAEERDRAQEELNSMPDVDTVLELLKNAHSENVQLEDTKKLVLDLAKCSNSINSKQSELDNLDTTIVSQEAKIEALRSACVEVIKQTHLLRDIRSHLIKIQNKSSESDLVNGEVVRSIEEYEAAKEELVTTIDGMDICPLSGGTLYDACKELLK